jgi:radical SAM superfamily enzyme YgiQ (UPF0313 family)
VQHGIESGSERILKLLQKDISLEQIRTAVAETRAAGLLVSIYLISGVPEESEEDIEATLSLIREILPHDGLVAPLALYPGTKLADDSKGYLGLDDSVWIKDPRDAIYVREDPQAKRHFRVLLEELERTGRKAAYRDVDFDRFDSELGFTFTTALQRSEWHRLRGETDRAIAAAEAIVQREPRNPWGPLRLADLHAELGEDAAARRWRKAAERIGVR